MLAMKLLSATLIFIFIIAMVPTNLVHSYNYNKFFTDIGISIPESHIKDPKAYIRFNTKEISVSSFGTYSLISLLNVNGWKTTYINSPGLPDLPVLVKVIKVRGYVTKSDVKVGIYIDKFHIVKTPKPVVPTPQPLAYLPGSQYMIRYVENNNVYTSDNYFPGKVLNVEVWHGFNDETLIILRFYPINYNPVRSSLVIIDDATILLSYPKPVSYASNNGNGVVILTSKKLVNATKELVAFYKTLGYNVSIVTVEQINTTYSPAEPPSYPGFANPSQIDYVYLQLKKVYDFNLSLKIIKFLRENENKFSYLVIIGDAKTVPPSYYYQYPFKTGLDPYNSWIPTDFFYASPDYDLAPNIYVGRIPFSDPKLIESFIEKEIKWYNTSVAKENKLIMSGGYPFLLPAMFGESAISTFTYRNSTSHFNVTLLTRTLGNYDNLTVKKIFEGKTGALWYFALSHGSGFALMDVRLLKSKPGSFPRYTFEVLMSSMQLLSLKPNPAVPIVSSVACMNGAWDDALLKSPYFSPPSFGEAVLLSPAGGIAYIGSARIAWELEGPTGLFDIVNGTLVAEYYGATLLHEEILRAYNSLGPSGATLGEVYEKGIEDYIIKAMGLYSKSIDSAIVLSEAFKAELLGDPTLKLPKLPSTRAVSAYISTVKPLNYTLMLNLTKLTSMPVLIASGGTLPVYVSSSSFSLSLKGITNSYGYEFIRIYKMSPYMLAGYNTIGKNMINLKNGSGLFKAKLNSTASGLLLVEFYKEGWGMVKFLLGSMGVTISPKRQVAGGLINISAYGLDLFNINYVDLTVVGRKIVSSLPVSPLGNISWSTVLPYIAPGTYEVTLYPHTSSIIIIESSGAEYQYPTTSLPEELLQFFSTKLVVFKRDEISFVIASPQISERGKVVVSFETLYKGMIIPANVSVKIYGPSGNTLKYTLTRSNKEFMLSFNATKVGTYLIEINASSTSKYLDARGLTVIPVTVIYKAYNGIEYLATILGGINSTLSTSLTQIKLLENGVAEVKTTLGTVLGLAKVINGTLLEISTNIGTIEMNLSDLILNVRKINDTTVLIVTKLGTLEGRVVSIGGDVAKVSTDLGTVLLNLKKISGDVSKVNDNIGSLNSTLSSEISDNHKEITVTKNYALSAMILALLAFLTAISSIFLLRRK